MKKKQWIGLAALTVLVLTLSVPNALAYFTTYASASGRVEMHSAARLHIAIIRIDQIVENIEIGRAHV